MVMDITKAWTMDYIRKESEKVTVHMIGHEWKILMGSWLSFDTGSSPHTNTSPCKFCRPGSPSAGVENSNCEKLAKTNSFFWGVITCGKICHFYLQVTQMQIADFVERFSRPGDEAAEVRISP